MPLVVDILSLEMESGASHWLSWRARNKDKIDAVRQEHRQKYLAARAAAKATVNVANSGMRDTDGRYDPKT